MAKILEATATHATESTILSLYNYIHKACKQLAKFEFKNGDNNRDGNKSPQTRFNKAHAHSSKTEHASEITMTPALYRHTMK